MAQSLKGLLLISQCYSRCLGQEAHGRVPGALKLRAEGLNRRRTGARHAAPERLGDVPGFRCAALGVEMCAASP
eukprot:11226239-Lingulodinium_polyedra.AAC.1